MMKRLDDSPGKWTSDADETALLICLQTAVNSLRGWKVSRPGGGAYAAARAAEERNVAVARD